MRRLVIVTVLLFAATRVVWCQDVSATRVLQRFQTIRPTSDELAMYRLDWADSLETALKRAAREKRPVLLVIIHAKYGDIFAGHC